MWSCYLLQTKDRTSTYIGATINVHRRLRQHNGELAGGAKATSKRKGEWERVVTIHGFPDKTSALRFEWRWKRNSRYKRKPCVKLLVARSLLLVEKTYQTCRLIIEKSIRITTIDPSNPTMIPVCILGCPIQFSVMDNQVVIDVECDAPDTVLAPGRIYEHPILGNMTPEGFQVDPITGRTIKVFCSLMDNKKQTNTKTNYPSIT